MDKKLSKQTLVIIGAALLIATVVVGYMVFVNPSPNESTSGSVKNITNDKYGISFAFQQGEDAFTLVEPPENQAGINKSYIILPTKAYNEYKNSDDVREAPAGMTVFIRELKEEDGIIEAASTDPSDRAARLKEWALKNDGLTQYSQKKAEPEEVEIDSVKALKYQADGLYQQTIYLATYKNNVYMFVNQYNEESDMNQTSFETFLSSISFN